VPLPEIFEKLADLKFDGVELCGFKPQVHSDDYPTKESRQGLVQMIKDQGLEVCGFAPDFGEVPPAVASEEKYEEVFRRNLELCVDLGAPKIRVDTVSEPPLPPGIDYDQAWSNVVKTWAKCAQIAQEAGVKLVWEFEPGFMLNKPSEVIRLVNEVNHPNFWVLFDTCHAHMCAVVAARQEPPKDTLPGGAAEFAPALTRKFGHLHLSDSDETLHDERTSTHAPFGQGVLDFDEIMPTILAAGYDDVWWSVDLCFWAQAWEVTADAKKFVDRLREKYGG